MIGTTVSHYRILEKLGEGGMGVVYSAEDLRLGRIVAIKFLSATTNSHHFRARFLREARAISLLSHPNIATLFDYGETTDDQPFIVMELVRGETLNDLLTAGRLNLVQSIEIVVRVADALAEAHSQGIVHRDVKPSNIILTDRGQVKVLDFGLAKHMADDLNRLSDPEARTLLATRTQSDVVVGTPLYLSPEQATSGVVDGRSDLFALGALLYEAISGRPAFAGASFMEIGAQVIHVDPQPPSVYNPRISKELERITVKSLEKKPEDRYQSAREFQTDLEAVLVSLGGSHPHRVGRVNMSGVSPPSSALLSMAASLRRPRLSIFSVALAVCLLGLVVWVTWRFTRPGIHTPTPEALGWYTRGTNALRDGAYYQASQMLARAVSADSKFALGHAMLAEAYLELDNSDGAKDELLAISSDLANPSSLTKLDGLRLKAVNATARRDLQEAISSYAQILEQVPVEERQYAYLDLGRAYERNEQIDKAIENYLKAIEVDGQYATAFLRVGELYSRRREISAALNSFDHAESIFKALVNTEGQIEVYYQRGVALRRVGKSGDARAQLQQAFDTAKATDYPSQQVQSLTALSMIDKSQSNFVKAQAEAREAVDLAHSRGLDNLAASALLEVGNSLSQSGDFVGADQYFKESLDLAKKYKLPFYEALAEENIGGTYIQRGKADEGQPLVEKALAWFRLGSYKGNMALCLTHIARAHLQRGEFEQGLKALEEEKDLSQKAGDQEDLAFAYGEIGGIRFEQGEYSKALESYEASYGIYNSLGDTFHVGYNQQNRGDILWRMGRYDEAAALLDDATALASKPSNPLKHLQTAIDLSKAQLSLSRNKAAEAESIGNRLLAEAQAGGYTDYIASAESVLGLSKTIQGKTKEGLKLSDEAIAQAVERDDKGLIARMILVKAAAQYGSGDFEAALATANDLLDRLHNAPEGGNLEVGHQASILAAAAAEKKHDQSAAGLLQSVRTSGSSIQSKWGADNYSKYLQRPDVKSMMERLSL